MPRAIITLFLVCTILLSISAPALAQDEECTEEDCEDCTACKTTNFYYVLAAAIIIFAVFFIWTNRNKVPKEPVEPEIKQDEPVQEE